MTDTTVVNDSNPIKRSPIPGLDGEKFTSCGEEVSTEVPTLPGGKVIGKFNPDFRVEVIRDQSFDTVHKLASGRVAGLQFKGVASQEWCDEVTRRFVDHPETHRESVVPLIYTLGKHLYACGSGTAIQCYFDGLDDTNRVMKSILPNKQDLLIEFLRTMAKENGMEFEFLEANGKRVEHGTLRLWGRKDDPKSESVASAEHSPLRYFANPHEDLKETNSDHPMLHQIQDCDNIYGVILCIQAHPGQEPRTILWDRELTLAEMRDPQNKFKSGSYGFATELLEDSSVCAIRLQPGDLGIIPAHKVHAVVGHDKAERCTLSGFIHFVKDDTGRPTKIVYRT